MRIILHRFENSSGMTHLIVVGIYLAAIISSLFAEDPQLRIPLILFQMSISFFVIVYLIKNLIQSGRQNKTLAELLAIKKGELSALMDILPEMVWIGDSRSRYTSVNRTFMEEIQLPGELIIGKTPAEVWHEETAEKFNKDDDVVLKKKTIQYEDTMVDSQNNPGWVQITKAPVLDDKNKVKGFVGIARDISQEKNAENEKKELAAHLRQSQKMEAIGTLAGGIAHDFNNILAAIMGYTEISITEVPQDHPVFNRLERILKAANRGKDLVNQIMTFSRQHEQKNQLVRLDLIVEEALSLLRPLIPRRIEIASFNSGERCYVLADPTQIHQILMNLCTNAAYAMRETGGRMDLRVEGCELTKADEEIYEGLEPGPYVRLTVSDTGPGIDPQLLNRVFEPFFTTKKKGEGTGMGLAVVHGIVKSLKGSVVLVSEPDKGATFQILFPRAAEVIKEITKIVPPISTGNERILFVDDEELIADMAHDMLERLGYDVISLKSSKEALDVFRENPDMVNLVVTDLTMPHMTGEELAREMLQIRSDIPIIMCTGFSEIVTQDKAKKMGIKEYIMKPFLHVELASTIRKVLDSPSC